jgi:hypothetical protein
LIGLKYHKFFCAYIFAAFDLCAAGDLYDENGNADFVEQVTKKDTVERDKGDDEFAFSSDKLVPFLQKRLNKDLTDALNKFFEMYYFHSFSRNVLHMFYGTKNRKKRKQIGVWRTSPAEVKDGRSFVVVSGRMTPIKQRTTTTPRVERTPMDREKNPPLGTSRSNNTQIQLNSYEKGLPDVYP